MEDGRSTHARAAAAAAKKKKKREKNDAGTTREQPRHPVPFAQIPGIADADALRERLEALGATEPSFLIGKSLVMSDVNREQARLLFSCKRESPSQVTGGVFTETEMRFVEDRTGLLVAAFDRAGRSYSLTCKYLASNSGYRFITGWKAYVNDNGLGVGIRVELWCFRSRKLHNRYELRQGKGGKEEKVPVIVDSGHPDGSLGLVLLHYENDLLEPERRQAADDEPDEAPRVQETETGQGHMDKLADDGGTCAEPIKSKRTIAEDKLANGGGECVEPMIKERNTVIPRDEVFYAAIGLLKLKKHFGGGGGGGGGEGEGEGGRGGGGGGGGDRGGGER